MATLNLYRIQVNATLDGLEEVPGTRRDDVQTLTVERPQESVEIEAGRFEIGNMSATVKGLADDYFRDANDPERPFVAELYDEQDTLVFWGVVPQAHYDRRTQYTEFTALSADYLLKSATTVAARSQYEVEIPRWVLDESQSVLRLSVPLGTPVGVGDVVKIDFATGEYREAVMAVLPFIGVKWVYVPVDVETVTLTQGGLTSGFTIISGKLTVSGEGPALMVDADASIEPDLRSTFEPSFQQGNIDVADAHGQGWRVEYLDANGDVLIYLPLYEVWYPNSGDPRLITGLTDPQYLANATTAVLKQVSSEVGEGSNRNKITIYGREAWGYAPTLDGQVRDDYYSVETLIDALLHLGYGNDGTGLDAGGNPDEGRPLGIFPWIIRNVTVRDGFDLGAVDIKATFANKPLAALRELQMASESLIRFSPVVTNGIPRLDAEIIPRTKVSDAETAVSMNSGIIEWTEAATPRKVDAVVVKANDSYMQPKDNREYVGFWMETSDGRTPPPEATEDDALYLTQAERGILGVPEGGNVLTITVPVVPAYEGFAYAGGKVVNDRELINYARYYYEWFNTVSREVRGSVYAADPDVLGKVVSVGTPVSPEGEGSRAFFETLFVTKVSPSLTETRTDFEGYILPTFIPPAATNPVARISGALVYRDLDGSGDETIYLSGNRSYNPNGNALSYLWETQGGGGGWITLGTTAVLQTDLSLGIHPIRLTVTDPISGLTGVTTVSVTVTEYDLPPVEEGGDDNDPRGYNSEQYQVGNDGFVRIYPNAPLGLSRVIWRRSSGAPLQEIDWDAQSSPDFWYTRGPLTQANYATNANGDYLVFDVPLDELHLSWIECWIEWNDPTLEPTVARFNLDADSRAEFINTDISIDTAGNVFLTVQGDGDTQRTNGIVVSTVELLDSDPAPGIGSYVQQGTYDNPMFDTQIHSGLASGERLYVKVELLNETDGAVGSTTYLSVTNTRQDVSGQIDYLILDSSFERSTFQTPAEGIFFMDRDGSTSGLNAYYNGSWARLWDSKNDGPGSGLNADLWDNNQFASVLDQAVRTGDSPQWAGATFTGDAATEDASFVVRGPNGQGDFRVGLFYEPPGGGSVEAGIGFDGTNPVTGPDTIFLGFSASPWAGNGLYVKASGRVGINVENPQNALDLSGTFQFRDDQLPQTNYSSSIGSLDKQLLALYVAELWVNTLVAQETRSTVGGSLLVTHSSELVQDMGSAFPVMYTKHNAFVVGDVLQMQKFNPGGSPLTQIEFIRILTYSGTTTVNGAPAHVYGVERNIDGTGANNWLAGDSVVSTGNGASPGGGFIHLFANTSFTDPSVNLSGPTITFNQRTGTAHDAMAVRTAIGRLEGYYGVSDPDTFGFGAGSTANYVRVVEDEILIHADGETVFRVDDQGLYVKGSGEFTGQITANSGVIAGWTLAANYLRKTSGTNRIELNSSSRGLRGEQQINGTWCETFRVSAQDSFTSYDSTIQSWLGSNAQLFYGSSTYTQEATSVMGSTETFDAQFGYKINVDVDATSLGTSMAYVRLGVQAQGYHVGNGQWENIGPYALFTLVENQIEEFPITEVEDATPYNQFRLRLFNRGNDDPGGYFVGELTAAIRVYETVDKTQITSRGVVISASATSYIEMSRDKFEVAGRNMTIKQGVLVLDRTAIAAGTDETLTLVADTRVNIETPNLNVTGNVNGATKNFRIPHPDPQKFGRFELWHSSVESPTAGETLYTYRVTVDASGMASVPLEDYWYYLNENPRTWVQGVGHTGRAFADVQGERVVVYGEPGEYDVLLIGTRIDPAAQKGWKGAERRATA